MTIEGGNSIGEVGKGPERLPENSPELAWLLGVVCSGGTIQNKRIILSNKHPEFINRIKLIAEDRLGWHVSISKHEDRAVYVLRLHLGETLRSLRSPNWPTQLRENFPWIYSDEEKLWQFVAGFFDYKGRLTNPIDNRGKRSCQLALTEFSEEGRQELLDILLFLGIKGARLYSFLQGRAQSANEGVGIFRFDQIAKFADKITSVIPDKEARLEKFRQEKLKLVYEEEIKRPKPSTDLAWLLGVLSSCGGVHLTQSDIRLQHKDQDFIEAFKETAEKNFGLIGLKREVISHGKGSHQVNFYSRRLINFLGDLRHSWWADTIKTNHYWILNDENFVKAFLSGFLDGSGRFANNGSRSRMVILNATSLESARLLLDLLSFVGVNGNIYTPSIKEDRKIEGVAISRFEEIQKFSFLVTSRIKSKERLLQSYRLAHRGPRIPEFEESFEAYDKVMKLKVGGLNVREILEHPDIVRYNLSSERVKNWLSGKNSPYRGGKYTKTIFPASEDVNLLDTESQVIYKSPEWQKEEEKKFPSEKHFMSRLKNWRDQIRKLLSTIRSYIKI